LAFIIISDQGLMTPSSYKQSFVILKNAGILTPETTEKMSKMAGFRNIAIHDYQKLDPAILKSILTKNLKDFEDFCTEVLK